MIRGSILASQRTVGGAGFLNSGKAFTNKYYARAISIQSAIVVNHYDSLPQGYAAYNCIYPSIFDNGVAGKAVNYYEASASIVADGYVNPVDLNVVISTTALADLLINFAASLNITVNTLCGIVARAYFSSSADISARPTAYDIAQEIWLSNASAVNIAGTTGGALSSAGSAGDPWTSVIESGYTAKEILQILAAVAVGKTLITDLGGGNATVKFRDINDTRDAVEASMVGSKRDSVTIT